MKSQYDDKKNMRIKKASSLKIAMIGHKQIPSRDGGIEVVVEELSKRLVKEGHEVYAYNRMGSHTPEAGSGNSNNLTAHNKATKEYNGIHIVTIPTLHNTILNAFVYSVLGTIRALAGHYDAIHYHAEGPCAMLWLPHLFGIRTVATIHGLDWKRAKWSGFAVKYLRFGEEVAAKYADEIIVLSRNAQDYFMNTYKRKVKFIPNGIVKPVIKGTEAIYKNWDLHKDGYILFLARIVPEKGLHYLIDAYREVDTLKKLVIAGPSAFTEEYMLDIKRRAAADGRIIFTGFTQGEELEELYSNAYLYVLPSDLEGMPISLLEAMSYGNCCVVSDIPECLEVVEDKAVSFKKGDVEDLSTKLNWLVENPDIVKSYKEKASDFICGKYNWDNILKSTISLYKKH